MEKSVRELNRLIRINPDDPFLYYERAGVHHESEMSHLALEDLDIVKRLDPGAEPAQIMRSLIHYDLNEYSEAIDILSKLIGVEPDHPEAHFYRGIALHYRDERGDVGRASADLERAFALDPTDPRFSYGIGLSLLKRDRRVEALERVNAAIIGAQTCPPRQQHPMCDYYLLRGRCRTLMGELELAGSDFQSALTLQPNMAAAHENMAYIKNLTNDLETAFISVQKAIRLNPQFSTYMLRATIHRRRKNNEAAIDDLRTCIRINPAALYPYLYVAEIYLENGMIDDALKVYDDMEREVGNHGLAETYRAEILYRQDRADEAIEILNNLISDPKADSHDQALYVRGRILDEQNKTEPAMFDYSMAITANPTHQMAFTARGRLRKKLGQTGLAREDFRSAMRIQRKMSV